jgi:anti-sigma regulatory factor (Ser/Thr protein kinase)
MDASQAWKHSIDLPPETGSPARAREFVAEHLRTHALFSLVDDIRLVASELVTNAVTHARTPLRVTLQQDRAGVTLYVEDDSSTGPRTLPRDLSAPNGRGIVLVAALSSDWGVLRDSSGSKSVWASFGAVDVAMTPG